MKTILSLLLFGALASVAAGKKPNVLYILCDDLRLEALGCYGSAHVKTPHIDRLAAEGVRFANAFCTTSICSPSRASIMTGLYAHKHTVVNNFTDLPAELDSFPKRLKSEGYKTAYIGKWHMGEDKDDPRPGFDWWISHKGQGSYFDTEFNINGQKREVVPGYYTTVVTDMALDWMKKQPKDQPWCMMIGHKAPHSFYFPEPKYEKSFDHVTVPYPATAFQLDDKPAWIKERLYTWHGIYGPLFEWRKDFPDDSPDGVKDFERMVRAYWGTVLSVDDSLGRMRGWLEETGQWDNTIILFLGDNGLLEGEHGMVDKRTAHEASIRIPMILRSPGTPAKVVQEQVLTVDVAPSLLEMCGSSPIMGVDGRSWLKLLTEGDEEWRKSWVYYYNYEKQFPYTPNVRALRTDEFKYIRYPHGDGSPDKHLSELYDLKKDPGETTNLINDPAHQDRVTALKHQLAEEMEKLGLTAAHDPMPLDEGVKKELPDAKIR
jgi:arylsulfatase A-like enzyme